MQKNNSYTAALKYAYAYFVMMFTLFASTVIFYRSVEIIQNLYYTSAEKFGILAGIGFVLIWLSTLAKHSAESVIKSIKGDKNDNQGRN